MQYYYFTEGMSGNDLDNLLYSAEGEYIYHKDENTAVNYIYSQEGDQPAEVHRGMGEEKETRSERGMIKRRYQYPLPISLSSI